MYNKWKRQIDDCCYFGSYHSIQRDPNPLHNVINTASVARAGLITFMLVSTREDHRHLHQGAEQADDIQAERVGFGFSRGKFEKVADGEAR